jgi:hypothetical protein
LRDASAPDLRARARSARIVPAAPLPSSLTRNFDSLLAVKIPRKPKSCANTPPSPRVPRTTPHRAPTATAHHISQRPTGMTVARGAAGCDRACSGHRSGLSVPRRARGSAPPPRDHAQPRQSNHVPTLPVSPPKTPATQPHHVW